MNWYLAKIVYRIISGDGNHTAQFDEQLRLLHATDARTALEKAERIGVQEAQSFLNIHQETVQWQYLHVTELLRLSDQVDGAEMYSLIRESENPDTYIDHIGHSASRLKEASCPAILQLI